VMLRYVRQVWFGSFGISFPSFRFGLVTFASALVCFAFDKLFWIRFCSLCLVCVGFLWFRLG
jgi:hypothetical protein